MMARAKKHRAQYFKDRAAYTFKWRLAGVGCKIKVAHDIFDDHDRAVDDHSEIQCAERKQIGRNLVEVQANRREQQGKRNGQRHDQRAAHISQKEKQNHGHQQDTFDQVMHHGVSGVVDQIGCGRGTVRSARRAGGYVRSTP